MADGLSEDYVAALMHHTKAVAEGRAEWMDDEIIYTNPTQEDITAVLTTTSAERSTFAKYLDRRVVESIVSKGKNLWQLTSPTKTPDSVFAYAHGPLDRSLNARLGPPVVVSDDEHDEDTCPRCRQDREELEDELRAEKRDELMHENVD